MVWIRLKAVNTPGMLHVFKDVLNAGSSEQI